MKLQINFIFILYLIVILGPLLTKAQNADLSLLVHLPLTETDGYDQNLSPHNLNVHLVSNTGVIDPNAGSDGNSALFSINNYKIIYTDEISQLDNLQDFTLSFKCKFTQTAQKAQIIDMGGKFGLQVFQHNQFIKINMCNQDQINSYIEFSQTETAHITLIYKNGLLQIYLNGVFYNQDYHQNCQIQAKKICLGNNCDTETDNAQQYTGTITNLRLFNSALLEQEINILASHPNCPTFCDGVCSIDLLGHFQTCGVCTGTREQKGTMCYCPETDGTTYDDIESGNCIKPVPNDNLLLTIGTTLTDNKILNNIAQKGQQKIQYQSDLPSLNPNYIQLQFLNDQGYIKILNNGNLNFMDQDFSISFFLDITINTLENQTIFSSYGGQQLNLIVIKNTYDLILRQGTDTILEFTHDNTQTNYYVISKYQGNLIQVRQQAGSTINNYAQKINDISTNEDFTMSMIILGQQGKNTSQFSNGFTGVIQLFQIWNQRMPINDENFINLQRQLTVFRSDLTSECPLNCSGTCEVQQGRIVCLDTCKGDRQLIDQQCICPEETSYDYQFFENCQPKNKVAAYFDFNNQSNDLAIDLEGSGNLINGSRQINVLNPTFDIDYNDIANNAGSFDNSYSIEYLSKTIFSFGYSDFTIAFYIKYADSNNLWNEIIFQNSDIILSRFQNTNHLQMSFMENGRLDTSFKIYINDSSIWNHILIVRSDITNFTVYVNLELQNTYQLSKFFIAPNSDFYIGGTETSSPFHGLLDELRFYRQESNILHLTTFITYPNCPIFCPDPNCTVQDYEAVCDTCSDGRQKIDQFCDCPIGQEFLEGMGCFGDMMIPIKNIDLLLYLSFDENLENGYDIIDNQFIIQKKIRQLIAYTQDMYNVEDRALNLKITGYLFIDDERLNNIFKNQFSISILVLPTNDVEPPLSDKIQTLLQTNSYNNGIQIYRKTFSNNLYVQVQGFTYKFDDILVNQWQHIFLNILSDKVQIYVDRTLLGEIPINQKKWTNNQTWYIGNDIYGNSQFYGSIDEFRITTNIKDINQQLDIFNYQCQYKCLQCDIKSLFDQCRIKQGQQYSMCRGDRIDIETPGVCVCPTGKQEASINNTTCIGECDPNCNCNELNECIECSDARIPTVGDIRIFEENCKCPDEYYFDTGSNVCQQCMPNCLTCSDNISCDSCRPDLQSLSDRQQTSNCSCLSYQYDLDGVCTRCPYDCAECIDAENCTKCIDYGLVGQSRKPSELCQCPYNSSINTRQGFELCFPCSSKCDGCKTNQFCQACDGINAEDAAMRDIFNNCSCPLTHDDILGKGCVEKSTIPAQECPKWCICDEQINCIGCIDQFLRRDPDQNCACKDRYYEMGELECGNCLLNCKTCSNDISCDECLVYIDSPEMLAIRSQTVDCTCPIKYYEETSFPFFCLECPEKCLLCNSFTCTQCIDLNHLISVRVPSQSCICPPGYFDDLTSVECIKCINPNCETCSSLLKCDTCIGNEFQKSLRSKDIFCNCPEGYLDVSGQGCYKLPPQNQDKKQNINLQGSISFDGITKDTKNNVFQKKLKTQAQKTVFATDRYGQENRSLNCEESDPIIIEQTTLGDQVPKDFTIMIYIKGKPNGRDNGIVMYTKSGLLIQRKNTEASLTVTYALNEFLIGNFFDNEWHHLTVIFIKTGSIKILVDNEIIIESVLRPPIIGGDDDDDDIGGGGDDDGGPPCLGCGGGGLPPMPGSGDDDDGGLQMPGSGDDDGGLQMPGSGGGDDGSPPLLGGGGAGLPPPGYRILQEENDNFLYLGNNDTGDSQFDGFIDDFRLYDNLVPQEEIQEVIQFECSLQCKTCDLGGDGTSCYFDDGEDILECQGDRISNSQDPLLQDICVCPDQKYDDFESIMCQQCNDKCQICTNEKTCIQCIDYQSEDQVRIVEKQCSCPIIGYFDDGQKECQKCNNQNCLTCSDEDTCDTCQGDTNQKKIRQQTTNCQCPSTHYENENGICIACSKKTTNCTKCELKTGTCMQCQGDLIYSQATQKCKCPKNYYLQDLNNPFSSTCTLCNSEGVECLGNNQLSLQKGYWRQSQFSSVVLKCINNEQACANQDPNQQLNAQSTCIIGHHGPLCELCDLNNDMGQGKFYHSTPYECSSCDETTNQIFTILGILFYQFLVMYICVNGTASSILDKIYNQCYYYLFNSQKVEIRQTGIYMKFLLNFLFYVSILTTFRLDTPYIINILGNPYKELPKQFECVIIDMAGGIPLQYFNILFLVIIVLIQFIICLLVIQIAKKYFKQKKNVYVTQNLLYLYIFVIQGMFSLIFDSIACRDIGDNSYILGNLGDLCLTKEHYQYIFLLDLPLLLIFALVIPCILQKMINKQFIIVNQDNKTKQKNEKYIQKEQEQDQQNDQKQQQVEQQQIKQLAKFKKAIQQDYQYQISYAFLTLEYKPEAQYWEILRIYKKLAICMILSFTNDNLLLKSILLFILFTSYIILLKQRYPYIDQSLNTIDLVSCTVILVSIFMALFLEQNEIETWKTIFEIILVFFNLLIVLLFIQKIIGNLYAPTIQKLINSQKQEQNVIEYHNIFQAIQALQLKQQVNQNNQSQNLTTSQNAIIQFQILQLTEVLSYYQIPDKIIEKIENENFQPLEKNQGKIVSLVNSFRKTVYQHPSIQFQIQTPILKLTIKRRFKFLIQCIENDILSLYQDSSSVTPLPYSQNNVKNYKILGSKTTNNTASNGYNNNKPEISIFEYLTSEKNITQELNFYKKIAAYSQKSKKIEYQIINSIQDAIYQQLSSIKNIQYKQDIYVQNVNQRKQISESQQLYDNQSNAQSQQKLIQEQSQSNNNNQVTNNHNETQNLNNVTEQQQSHFGLFKPNNAIELNEDQNEQIAQQLDQSLQSIPQEEFQQNRQQIYDPKDQFQLQPKYLNKTPIQDGSSTEQSAEKQQQEISIYSEEKSNKKLEENTPQQEEIQEQKIISKNILEKQNDKNDINQNDNQPKESVKSYKYSQIKEATSIRKQETNKNTNTSSYNVQLILNKSKVKDSTYHQLVDIQTNFYNNKENQEKLDNLIEKLVPNNRQLQNYLILFEYLDLGKKGFLEKQDFMNKKIEYNTQNITYFQVEEIFEDLQIEQVSYIEFVSYCIFRQIQNSGFQDEVLYTLFSSYVTQYREQMKYQELQNFLQNLTKNKIPAKIVQSLIFQITDKKSQTKLQFKEFKQLFI